VLLLLRLLLLLLLLAVPQRLTTLPLAATVAASPPSPKKQAEVMPVLPPASMLPLLVLLLLGGTDANCEPSARIHNCRLPCASPDSTRVPQGLAAMLVMAAAAKHPGQLRSFVSLLGGSNCSATGHKACLPACLQTCT
jgi:hypothetical protein